MTTFPELHKIALDIAEEIADRDDYLVMEWKALSDGVWKMAHDRAGLANLPMVYDLVIQMLAQTLPEEADQTKATWSAVKPPVKMPPVPSSVEWVAADEASLDTMIEALYQEQPRPNKLYAQLRATIINMHYRLCRMSYSVTDLVYKPSIKAMLLASQNEAAFAISEIDPGKEDGTRITKDTKPALDRLETLPNVRCGNCHRLIEPDEIKVLSETFVYCKTCGLLLYSRKELIDAQ